MPGIDDSVLRAAAGDLIASARRLSRERAGFGGMRALVVALRRDGVLAQSSEFRWS